MMIDVSNAPVILRRKQVEARVGLRRSSLYQPIANGTFPQRIRIGARVVGWVESEISDWLHRRIAESQPNAKEAAK